MTNKTVVFGHHVKVCLPEVVLHDDHAWLKCSVGGVRLSRGNDFD